MTTNITLLINCADENNNIPNQVFGIRSCTIESVYQKDDTTISLSASGFTGEFSDGNIINAMPSAQFDDFCRVSFNAVNSILIKSFFLDEMDVRLCDLAKEYPLYDHINELRAKISKMANTIYNLSGNAKLLNKHPKKFRHLIF